MDIFRRLVLLAALIILLPSCKDLLDDYRKGGDFALGSAYKLLEKRGGYSLFLKAIDLSDYKRLVDGGGLVTVFAPNDAAFEEYLMSEFGTSDLDVIPKDKVALIVGYHLIQFSYNTDDFLAFSMSSTSENPQQGDGSCYKYKTYSRAPIQDITDPITRRKVSVFSRERYIPVFSTRIFKSRGVDDAQGDYKKFFPDVDWKGTDDRLYAGNASVVESGIATDNGYLYIIDKVSKPLPTIYEALGESWAADYSLYKSLFDKINYYQYSEALSKSYAKPGDSLFLFYHFRAPQAAEEIPEIASQWSYNDENGVVFERGLRYAVNCFAPKNGVLEPFLKEYFKEFGLASEPDNYIGLMPNNAIYHLLYTQTFGKRDLILPSELDKGPLVGSYGEYFNIQSSELKDIKFCTNGVVYGMDKYFMPAVFTHLTRPLFQYPKFRFYALAFNTKSMYQLTVDPNNRYTLFLQDDQTLLSNKYICDESPTEFGNYSFHLNRVPMNVNQVSDLVMANFVFGEVKDPTIATEGLRYYVSKDYKNYFYAYQGSFFDSKDNALTIKETYTTENGNVYYMDKMFAARNQGIMARVNQSNALEFKKLLISAKLITNNTFNFITQVVCFIPTNTAVIAAQAAGDIPAIGTITDPETGVVTDDLSALRAYLMYYFVPLQKNKLDHFLLPAIGPDGMTEDDYTAEKLITHVDYIDEADMVTIKFEWKSSDPMKVTITDNSGYSIDSIEEMPTLCTNAVAYTIEECFDYRTMVQGR